MPSIKVTAMREDIVQFDIDLPSLLATAGLGATLGQILTKGDVITLAGPLGAGKTTLARAVIEATTCETDIASPTFGLVQTYESPKLELYHFDLYRLESPEEVWELGIEEAFDSAASLIEWPDKAPSIVPENALRIRLSVEGETRHASLRCDHFWHERLEAVGIKNL